MNFKESYKSPLPKNFKFKNELPKNAQIGLSDRNLSHELSIWIDWMWDMKQSPSQQMTYEGIYILEKRMNTENLEEVKLFTEELIKYATSKE